MIAQDREGRNACGSRYGDGLGMYDEASRRRPWVDLGQLDLSNNITGIIEDHAGRIWVTTDLGAMILKP